MKVLLINSVCGQGSTGRICIGIAELLKANGHEAFIAYAHGSSTYPGSFCFAKGRLDYWSHNIMSRLTDSEGLHSSSSTKRLISQINQIKPDIIHIHTLHGHYINYKLLLEYLNMLNIPIVITLHDCWIFTGHCAHFEIKGCNKWRTGCENCKYIDEYPQSWFVDNSKFNYELKKKLLSMLGDKLTIIPVSFWMEKLVKQSFLKDMRMETIHNGIDLSIFSPRYNQDIFSKYSIEGKKLVLGVALPWSSYKGMPDFIKLRSLLGSDYAIIMVGLSKKQIHQLPEGIIGLEQTHSSIELAELYTAADVLVNTTYCDNYPTVNLEAIACGTPVVTYETGGSPESIDEQTGAVVRQGDLDGLVDSIKHICSNSAAFRPHCLSKARLLFDKNKCFEKYLAIYCKVVN